jgi:NADH:ubiquinone oxidoreductase subunit D
MRPEKPVSVREDCYVRHARKMNEFEESVFLIIAIVAASLTLLNLWNPFA